MEKTAFLERMEELLETGREIANKSETIVSSDPMHVDVNLLIKHNSWKINCSNLLRTFFGENHSLYKEFLNSKCIWKKVISKEISQPLAFCKESVAESYAILKAIKEETELNLISDAQHLYEANLFSDLLEQAFELLEKGYLVGAAVYCRLIIENFIEDLCRVNEIEISDFDNMPEKLIKLRKKEIINLPTERLIQANYDIGTFAVHGNKKFNSYKKEDLTDVLQQTKIRILTIS